MRIPDVPNVISCIQAELFCKPESIFRYDVDESECKKVATALGFRSDGLFQPVLRQDSCEPHPQIVELIRESDIFKELTSEGGSDLMVRPDIFLFEPAPTLFTAPHPDPEKRRQGLFRIAFLGHEYARPKPVKTIPLEPKYRSRPKTWEAKRLQLANKWGPEFHVEIYICFVEGPVFRIWHGEDWLKFKTIPFYPSELARIATDFPQLLMQVRVLVPLASKKIKEDRTRRKNSPSGGRATAELSDEQVLQALWFYKHKIYSDHKMSTAIDKLIERKDKGKKHYLNYKTRRKALDRLSKIFEGEEMRPFQWYNDGCYAHYFTKRDVDFLPDPTKRDDDSVQHVTAKP